MSYCPICEYEHRRKTICPDCGTPLVERPEEKDDFVCDECKEPVAADDLWCKHCGTIFVDTLRCFRHTDAAARGKCIVCGQHVCGSCGSLHMGQFFCTHDTETGMRAGDVDEDVVIADRDGDRLRGYLTTEGITCRIFKFEEDSRRATADDKTNKVKLLAPRRQKERADGVLSSRDIDLDIIRYECERCSAISSGVEVVCPNCREE